MELISEKRKSIDQTLEENSEKKFKNDEFEKFIEFGKERNYNWTEEDYNDFQEFSAYLSPSKDEKEIEQILLKDSVKVLTTKFIEASTVEDVKTNEKEQKKKIALLEFLKNEIFGKKLVNDKYFGEFDVTVAGGCVEYLLGFTDKFKDIDLFIDFKNHAPNTYTKESISKTLNDYNEHFRFVSDEDFTHYRKMFCCFDLYKKFDGKKIRNNVDIMTNKEGEKIEFKYEGDIHPVQVIVRFSGKSKAFYEFKSLFDSSPVLKDYLDKLKLDFPWNIIANFDFPTLCGSAVNFNVDKNEFKFFIVTENSFDFRELLNLQRAERVIKYFARFKVLNDNETMLIPCLNKRNEPFERFFCDEFNISYELKKFCNNENNDPYTFKDFLQDCLKNEILEKQKEGKIPIKKDDPEYVSKYLSFIFDELNEGEYHIFNDSEKTEKKNKLISRDVIFEKFFCLFGNLKNIQFFDENSLQESEIKISKEIDGIIE